MQEIMQWLIQQWPAALGTLTTIFLVPWLRRTGKEAIARRYALIARAIAVEVLAQFPGGVTQVIEKVTRILMERWPINEQTARTIAKTAVLEAAKLHREAATLRQVPEQRYAVTPPAAPDPAAS